MTSSTFGSPEPGSPGGSKKILGLPIGAIVAIVMVIGLFGTLIVGGIAYYAMGQSAKTKGNGLQASMGGAFTNGAIEMSKCTTTIKGLAGVATAQAEQFENVIAAAVSRTGDFAELNVQNDPGNTQARSALLPILTQTWPDQNASTALYAKVADEIVGCWGSYGNYQKVVVDKLREYDTWTGSWTGRTFGKEFPNDRLVVSVGGAEFRGADALAKIRKPIVTTVTDKAYRDGVFEPEDPFADQNTPAPTATP